MRFCLLPLLLAASSIGALAQETAPESLLENAFRTGSILVDTNNDHIPDAVCGHIIVPSTPNTAENVAAANFAARLGYETTGLTLPLVTGPTGQVNIKCTSGVTSIWVGNSALPPADSPWVQKTVSGLQIGEGGVFLLNKGLALVAADEIGLMAAADAYAARGPFQWNVPGDRLQAIAKTFNAIFKDKKLDATADLVGLTYVDNQPGIRRALLQLRGTADAAALRRALTPDDQASSPLHLGLVREVQIILPNGAQVTIPGGASATARALPSAPETPAEETKLLDLGTLYGIKGLLSGSPKRLVPAGVAAKLYIPAGQAGTALANLAARMGFETTGLTLPLAFPATGISPSQVQTAAIIAGDSPLATHVKGLLGAPGGLDTEKILEGEYAASKSAELGVLQPGEGELRVVDRAFGKNPALLIRGDEAGAAAASAYASGHLPFLWEPSKKFASVEEMRGDLKRFFSLRSGVGQTSVALFHLDRWMAELAKSNPHDLSLVTAEVDTDEADPRLASFIRSEIENRLHPEHADVKTGSLHAGKKCCDADPPLHYTSQIASFKQSEPTFVEDLVIPWEGRRLTEAVEKAVGNIARGDAVTVDARVSESPQIRAKLRDQILAKLKQSGVDPQRTEVKVLSAYKQGYSWLVDDIEPALKGQNAAALKIEFAPYNDPEKLSSLRSVSRWVQELYPVDEVLARDLSIPLKNIQLAEMPDDKGPTYRVHAYAADGHELLTREFSVSTFVQPYSAEFSHYDRVTVATGWVRLTSGSKKLLDERIPTDVEEFWDHYQTKTLPRMFNFVLQQNDGKPRIEFQPLFDTLKISFKLSEPDYDIGIDQERISSLEALQEDTLFSTQNYFYMMGDLVSNGMMDYQGRVIPVAYPSQDGQDGHVRIEFYAKDAGYPQVRLTWRAKGDSTTHERVKKLPALALGAPRLVAASLQAGQENVESLTWRLPADFQNYDFENWIKLEPEEQVERSVFSAEQARGQLQWLDRMHSAGLYRDSLDYPHLGQLRFEFELPLKLWASEHTKNEVVTAQLKIPGPVTSRPQITDFTPAPLDAQGHFVSWDKPIGPSDEEHLLSRLSKYPGVDVYWMGRTYLGRNIWAADIMLPSPSELRSMAKETTLKAAIVYSGRQHANEVSSTSHILRLAEQLVTDPQTREALNKVNVVVHPITNVDGAQLAMDLAQITPENMLHPGYHASLTADLVTAQWEDDPIYPESLTRRQLWEAWLPDAFLNPHGYPSHEWVQPFSEYAAWVITRMQADSGRAWWIPRGWFTSLGYLGDEEHRNSKTVTYGLRDEIASAVGKAPGILDMNARMNARYERYGQRWDEHDFQQPIYDGVRIYMALKGETPSPRASSFMQRYPDITYDDGYTEAPDETAYGPWLHLVASAGLAYDHAHLDYLSHGKFKIKRTEKEFFDAVQWKVDRERPILPANAPDASADNATPPAVKATAGQP